MLDAVTAVDGHHDPVIYEGEQPAIIVVTNAGPAAVEIHVWDEVAPKFGKLPGTRLELRAGNTKAVRGSLVRAHLISDSAGKNASTALFAALGWKVQS